MIDVQQGQSPLVLAMPHTGTFVPETIWDRLNETGRALADTDWHIHEIYQGLAPNATVVRTSVHRYVIDVNRDPFGASLYPGQNTTELCPVTDFDGREIYREGQEPTAEEIADRRATFHDPYHGALAAELERLHGLHGFALLWDCHSIRSTLPFLFEGTLPDFSIGTNSGTTCAHEIEAFVCRECDAAPGFSWVANGRFKGGWTTRHYGRPGQGFHAIQMELAQSTYGRETPPWTRDAAKSDRLRGHLRTLLTQLQNWRPQ